jgi:class 3 adenylate cyclase/tetratricopeptide (TPR) repeat protein
MDVAAWLHDLGLGRYEATFRDNAIEADVLPDLSEADLERLGVLFGHRLRLMRAIAGLRTAGATPVPRVPAPSPHEPKTWDAAERRDIAVLSCDLVGSTSISARLDAEEWRDLVSAYLDVAAKAVTEMGGYVANKVGDGLMALFGFPQAREDDAERAARAALEIQRALSGLNAANAGTGKPELIARVGVASGLVVVEATGEVFGDAPNLATRVQAFAEPGTVLITSELHAQIAGLFVADDRGLCELKGVPAPVRLCRLVRWRGATRRLAAKALTPLAGRADERAILADRWSRAKRGEGQMLFIVAEPGLGKSRLVEEFRFSLGKTRHTFVEWRCSQLLQNTALHPIMEWGRQHFDAEQSPERRLADLEATLKRLDLDPVEYLPPLAPAVDIALPPERMPKGISPGELRRRQLAALTAWVMVGARSQPVALVFEDLQWADPTTLELLAGLAEVGAKASLLLLATARPDFRPAWRRCAHHSVLPLAPLEAEDVERMIDSIIAGHSLSREMAEGVVARASGVPLFVEEVTRLLLESKEIGGASAIPATLRHSLAARLDRLGSSREIAQLAAVLGLDFNYALLREATNMGDAELADALERLVAADLLHVEGEPPDADFRFRHALIRDAAYESLLKSRRQALHRRVAEALSERFPVRAESEPEIVAHHFTAAGAHLQAVAYWRQAGLQAMQRFANQEAISHLRKALDELNLSAGSPEREAQEMALQIMLAVPLTLSRGWAAPEVEAAYRRAFDLSGRVGETPQLFPTLVGLLSYYVVSAQVDTACEMGERNLRFAERAGDPDLILEAEVDCASTVLYQGRFVETLRHVSRVKALYDPYKHHDFVLLYGKEPMVVAKVHEALALWCIGRPDSALAESLAAVAHSAEWVHPFSRAWALSGHVVILQMRGDVASMRETAGRVVALASEQGFPNWLAQGLTYLGWTMTAEGDFEAGVEKMREGLNIWGMTGAKLISCYLMYLLADGLRRSGRFDEALETLREDLRFIEGTGDEWWRPEIERLQGQVIWEQSGNRDTATAAFERSIALARGQGSRTLELRALTSLARVLDCGVRRDEALAALKRVYATFTEGFDLPDLTEARGCLTLQGIPTYG